MRPLIVANWKMNTTLGEAIVLASGVKEGAAQLTGVSIVLCPPFPWLVPVAEAVRHHPLRHLHLGAQNVFWQEKGAYTGEVAAGMLTGLAEYVIIGHSERRRHFHETDQEIGRKVKLALAHRLRPILCVGEVKKPSPQLLADPSELTASQLRQPIAELRAVLRELTEPEQEKLIVAYEPVWAISSSPNAQAATGFYANAVAGQLKELLPAEAPVLYGGSVTPENAAEFLHQPNVGGLLVGSASLQIKSFLSICKKGTFLFSS